MVFAAIMKGIDGGTCKVSDNGCDRNCAGCSDRGNCGISKDSLNGFSKISKVIGIVSGKGGVGKSTVTSIVARQLTNAGYRVGILDADLTGPSIPRMFGVTGKVSGSEMGMEPAVSEEGIRIMSMNLLLDSEEDAVILRGPVLSGVIKQFWTDVHWGELDYLLIDMPPGTGDIPLTVYQSIPIDGIVIVTSPQELVRMIVMKAFDMAAKMGIKVLGIIENYSYYVCEHCGEKHKIFGESGVDELAAELMVPVIAKIPVLPQISEAADSGKASDVSIRLDYFDNF